MQSTNSYLAKSCHLKKKNQVNWLTFQFIKKKTDDQNESEPILERIKLSKNIKYTQHVAYRNRFGLCTIQEYSLC